MPMDLGSSTSLSFPAGTLSLIVRETVKMASRSPVKVWMDVLGGLSDGKP